MAAPVKLTYHDEAENVTVEVRNYDLKSAAHYVTVHRGSPDARLIAALIAPSLGQAQAIARMLVGIEIQPDGAAWRRGPRPPAQPTEASHEG